MGLKVVAFDIGAVREVTADGRFADLVPVGDVAALAEAMVAAATTERDPAEVAAQVEWIQEHYEAAAVAEAVEALLIETARRSRAT